MDVFNNIAEYYTKKINRYGATPAGVDWNGEKSQILRFKILCDVICQNSDFSINDLGSGYGGLADYLLSNFGQFVYHGYDLSKAMVDAALVQHSSMENISFYHINKTENMNESDYTLASGIFNVKMNHSETEWLSHIMRTIDVMNIKSRLGFAFNVLTKYSDAELMNDKLYYADPCFMFDACKNKYSRHVSLIHNYGLYEFTIVVNKKLPEIFR